MIEHFRGIVTVEQVTFSGYVAELKIGSIIEGDENLEEALFFEDGEKMSVVTPLEQARGILPGDQLVISGYLDCDEESIYDVEYQVLQVNDLQDFGIVVEDEDDEEDSGEIE